MLKDALRLKTGGGSSSDSVSPSSHRAGYCCFDVCDDLRTTLGVASSSSGDTVSVRARPVSSMMSRVRGLRISGIDLREPLFCRFSGDERRGMWCGATAPEEDLDSVVDGLPLRKPLSVLLRCNVGFLFSTEPEDELVLERECWLFGFFAISLSRLESSICVSYGCRDPAFLLVCCGMVPNELVMSGSEKLKSILGSTPAVVEANEPGLELRSSSAVTVPNEANGSADDMLCRGWKTCEFIWSNMGVWKLCQFRLLSSFCGVGPNGSASKGISTSMWVIPLG
jgi:hypothetical protein